MPSLRNQTHRYGLVSVVFHWLTALTIIGLFALGYWMVDLGYYSAWYNRAPSLHKSIGMLLLPAIVAWQVWKGLSPSPPAAAGVKPWEARAARFAHHLLYLLILAIIASGYLIPTAEGRGIDVFGWFTVPALPVQPAGQADVAGWLHRYLAYAIMALAALHAAAALKHHFVNKDATLRRMLGLADKRNNNATQKEPS